MTWLPTSSPTCDGRAGARFDGRPHAADVAADDRGHIGAADVDALDDFDIGRLGHGVGRFDQPDQSFGFNQSDAAFIRFTPLRCCSYSVTDEWSVSSDEPN